MIIKEAIYKEVMKPIRVQVEPAVYGCDNCKTEITGNDTLLLTIYHEEKTESKEFCSWDCVFNFIKNYNGEMDFIEFPSLYEDKNDKISIDRFKKLIK
jgi:hypothetical protein